MPWTTQRAKGEPPIVTRHSSLPGRAAALCAVALATAIATAAVAQSQQPVAPGSLAGKALQALPSPPAIKAESAILIDAATGQVLYEKNPDEERPPASTTKIMTAILLLEHLQPTDVIVASKHASETGGSALHLLPGERITAHDMLYALMLRSANDGCVAVAERVAGSEQRFAQMMTEKAREIGCTHTVFQNCNGLNENPNHTSARDLATMARYAFRYPAFDEAVSSKFYTVARSMDPRDVVLRNHAKFLWHFPGADGVKTGWTVPAGHCFVGAATWNGWRLVSVVMHSPDIVAETSTLMKYGFQRFQTMDLVTAGQVFTHARIAGGEMPTVPAAARDAIRYVVERGETPSVELRARLEPLTAPIAPGVTVGSLEAVANGVVVGSTPLVSTAGDGRAPSTMGSLIHGGTTGWVVGVLGMGVLVLGAGYGTAITKTARRRGYRLKALLREPDR